jgi:hypothetical protein
MSIVMRHWLTAGLIPADGEPGRTSQTPEKHDEQITSVVCALRDDRGAGGYSTIVCAIDSQQPRRGESERRRSHDEVVDGAVRGAILVQQSPKLYLFPSGQQMATPTAISKWESQVSCPGARRRASFRLLPYPNGENPRNETDNMTTESW